MKRRGSLDVSPVIVALVVLLAGAAVGWAVVFRGPGAVTLVPGVAAGLAVLLQPLLGLLGVVAIVPVENLLTIGDWGTATKALSAFVCGAWFLRKLARRESWERVLGSPVFMMVVLFLAYSTASSLWSVESTSIIQPELARMAMLMGLGVLTADLVRDWEQAILLVKLLVLGGLIAGSLTVQQYFIGGASRAGEGIGGGINATATSLLIILPLAFGLVRAANRRIWRLVAFCYIPVAIVAIVVTFSRMALIVLTLVLAYEYWRTFRRSDQRALVIGGTMVVALAVVPFLPVDELGERVESIGPYLESIVEPDQGPVTEVSGRGYHIYVALAIFQDHPVVGAGFGNYGDLFVERYQFRVPGAERLYGTSRSPHGNYWGFLADLGVVGLLLWLILIGLAFQNLWRARKLLTDHRDSIAFNLCAALMVMFVVQILYGAYENMHLDKLQWIVIGLTVAFYRLAERAGDSDRTEATVDLTAPARPEGHSESGRHDGAAAAAPRPRPW